MNKKNIILIVVGVVLGFIALCVLGLGLLVYLAVKFPKDPNESTTEITTEIVTTTVTTEEVKIEEAKTEEPTTEQQTEEIGAMHYNELLPFYENESGELYLTLEVEDNGNGTYLVKTTGSVLGESDEGYSNEFVIEPIDEDETYESTDGRFKVLVMGNSIELTDNESSPYMVDGTFVTPGTNTGMAVDEFPFIEASEMREFIRNASEGQPFSFKGTVGVIDSEGNIDIHVAVVNETAISFEMRNVSTVPLLHGDEVIVSGYFREIGDYSYIIIEPVSIELAN